MPLTDALSIEIEEFSTIETNIANLEHSDIFILNVQFSILKDDELIDFKIVGIFVEVLK